MKFILNEQSVHLKFVFKNKIFLSKIYFSFILKEHQNRLNEIITKAKDLKTKLYDECLAKDLAKIFIDKIDQMIVNLQIY